MMPSFLYRVVAIIAIGMFAHLVKDALTTN